jgi:hypothetical protein
MRNSWPRKALAVAAVLLLSVPSAVGVQRALEPTRGWHASWLAAAGFEAVYLAVALLALSPTMRRYAHRVALSAVATAIFLNVIADYSKRVPGGLANWTAAQRLFDPLALGLAVAESVPLAALAFAMATLLHRLAEEEADDLPTMERLTARALQAEAQAADLAARLGTAEEQAAQARHDADRAVAESGTALEQAQHEAEQRAKEAARLNREADRLRQALAQAQDEAAQQAVTYNGQRLTLAQLVGVTGVPQTTLRRKLAQLTETTAQAAD